METTDLLIRARAGDGEAFARLIDPHRRELHVHCYRILASTQDAEDALQETLLAAWQGLAGFEGRASIRTWLYRIATTRCLNALRSGSRRPRSAESAQPPTVPRPEHTRLGEVLWLEPYPDALLDGVIDVAAGPEARYESREAISLAFVTAVQALPPRQRAVLILRDVLGFEAREVAQILDSTPDSVTSALKRARATLRAQTVMPAQTVTRAQTVGGDRQPAADTAASLPDSPAERRLVSNLTQAFADADIDGLVALLTDDVLLTMPPIPLEYQGRDLVAQFYSMVVFRPGRRHRLVPTRANGQPAVGIYVGDPHSPVLHANGLMVLTLNGDRISVMTRFDNSVISRFALPRLLPA